MEDQKFGDALKFLKFVGDQPEVGEKVLLDISTLFYPLDLPFIFDKKSENKKRVETKLWPYIWAI